MDTNVVSQARKDIKYITSLVRGLVALDEVLERVGGLDKLISERESTCAELETKQRRAASLDAEIAEKDAQLRNLNAGLARVREIVGRVG